MKIIKGLLLLCMIVLIGCTREVAFEDFISIHHKERLIELSNDNNHYDVVFMGDSITEGGNFESVINNSKNAGIAGDWITKTKDVVPYVVNYSPRKVYLMIGINSLRVFTLEDCVTQYLELISLMVSEMPNTEIIIESVLPISVDAQHIVIFNNFLKEFSVSLGLKYIDLYSLYEVEGKLPDDITTDGLHLSSEGYEKWYEVLREEN